MIAGESKSGKSTIAELIAYTLNNSGIPSVIEDSGDKVKWNNVNNLYGKLKVDIKVKQSKRMSNV